MTDHTEWTTWVNLEETSYRLKMYLEELDIMEDLEELTMPIEGPVRAKEAQRALASRVTAQRGLTGLYESPRAI